MNQPAAADLVLKQAEERRQIQPAVSDLAAKQAEDHRVKPLSATHLLATLA